MILLIFLIRNPGSTTSEIRDGINGGNGILDWVKVRCELDKLVARGSCRKTDVRGLVRFYYVKH